MTIETTAPVIYGPNGQVISSLAPGGASRNALDVNLASSGSGLAARATGTFAAAPGAITTPNTANVANTTVTVPVGNAGNVTVDVVVAAAYVGTFVFEASADGGNNYAPISMGAEDGATSDTGRALAAASVYVRQWTTATPGFTHFRVRAIAWTSGSIAVGVTPGPFLTEAPPFISSPIDGQKATYIGNQSGTYTTQGAAFAGALCTLTGSATKVVRLTRFEIMLISSTATAGGVHPIYLTKSSSATTGGTSSAGTVGPVDSNDPAATATVVSYTAVPTPGASVSSAVMSFANIPAAGSNPYVGAWTFGNRPSKAPVLRGTAQQMMFELGSAPGAALQFNFVFEWTEEAL